jgi:ABC-type transporter Mla subunit MlaD
MTAGMVDATAYLVLDASRARYGRADTETGLRPVESVKVAGIRVGRPSKLAADQVAVKVTIRVPVEVFDPLTPAALIARRYDDRNGPRCA